MTADVTDSRIPTTPTPEQASSRADLRPAERLFYRDRLREARYVALADSEGFEAICYALEVLGLRLLGTQIGLGKYKPEITRQADRSLVLNDLAEEFPLRFKSFEALFAIVLKARNDAMHSGAYARHATQAAIELCIGLEEALMVGVERTVRNLMVSSPVTVESWQPVAYARQLMLMHSYSFLPVRLDDSWCLVSELGLAKYLSEGSRSSRQVRLCESIETACRNGMQVIEIARDDLLSAQMQVDSVLAKARVQDGPMLWLVVDEHRPDHLAGVLSPFELM